MLQFKERAVFLSRSLPNLKLVKKMCVKQDYLCCMWKIFLTFNP